ncbi:MAG TPA: hypothetical protein VLF18_09325 [Tahibacter sp.]|uniref:hypothetical protein n=1 Tax=Tahibacter sp. TaxID=2056211 RepID=UPI002CB1C786|nr:hypothetical protein [Tahibacter sp.]HSX60387.1 hypothetical protein [Tahibacter sp.]
MLAALLPPPVQSAGPLDEALPIDETLQAMRKLDADIVEPLQKAPRLDQQLVSIAAAVDEDRLPTLSDAHARNVFDAARLAGFYGHSPKAVSVMRLAWDELRRRGLAPAGSGDEVLEQYIGARLFDDARAFRDAHPTDVTFDPPRLIDIVEPATRPTILTVSGDGRQLTRRVAPPLDELSVVVTGAPGCPFTRAAVDAIERNPELSSVMSTHALWLMPQQSLRDTGAIARWNSEHPAAVLSLVYRQSEWPFIRTGAMPTFYFFRSGNLVSSFSGWRGAEQEGVLRGELVSIGLLKNGPASAR